MRRLNVAVVHDYLTQRGGAERVALAIMKAFPDAPLFTSVYAPASTFPEFRDVDVRPTWLDRLPPARRDPRIALPLLPRTFSGMNLPPDIDVVVCSSSGWAHGVRTAAPKIVYCHNPPRWLHQTSEYAAQQPLPARVALEVMRTRLHRWDAAAAGSAAVYLVNSTVVRERVARLYGIHADVVAPPYGLDPTGDQEPVPGLEPGFLLTVSRARGYKNASVLAAAVEAMPGERLVSVGGLPEHPTGGTWGPRLTGLTGVSDAHLRWLYANCAALLAVSYEDFGLSPVEANAFGRPAVCLRSGGYLDTLLPGVSGVFVERLSPGSVIEAVTRVRQTIFDREAIRAHAARFSPQRFTAALHDVVARTVTATAARRQPVPAGGPTVVTGEPPQVVTLPPGQRERR